MSYDDMSLQQLINRRQKYRDKFSTLHERSSESEEARQEYEAAIQEHNWLNSEIGSREDFYEDNPGASRGDYFGFRDERDERNRERMEYTLLTYRERDNSILGGEYYMQRQRELSDRFVEGLRNGRILNTFDLIKPDL